MKPNFEERIKDNLYHYLLGMGEVDEQLPEAIDLEERWPAIGQSYLADGVREFDKYPTASLGWMMYIGMGMAKYWDDDWGLYSKVEDLYLFMRDKGGYDLLDEYVRGPLLGLKQPEYDNTETLVQECAERTYSMYLHEQLEPGSEAAFRGYVICLHQLYLMGAAVQLKRMGYKMVKKQL
ncbi:MAG: hypothetical protein MJZ45_04415 [Bacteroidales bacterium]|nr:hypothetical protein [Bacteroidales bacterium]